MDIITEARKYQKLKKISLDQADLKIAVIGSTSIQYFTLVLDYILHLAGIDAIFYEGEYDGIAMDVFDDASPLYCFCPQIVIILTHYMDIKTFPEILNSQETVSKKANSEISYYRNIWKQLDRIENVQILQSNFVIPPEHLFGNLETQVAYSKTNFYRTLNQRLAEDSPDYVTIVDVELLADYIGKKQWFDYKSYFLHKLGYRMDYLKDIANLFKKQIMALKGQIRKCLVLDLDNTLWGGVVGDDGYDGIQLDPNHAIGEAYRYFQSYILGLKRRGVILAVCSKNDEENAKEPFEKNTNMIIKMEDIACFVANWDDKVTNIKRIARDLNIGTDSMVFFDDNPAEREIIRKYLPEVHVVDVPKDPALYALQLDEEDAFDWAQLTEEDINRSKSYVENRSREELESRFADYNEYLKALEMSGTVGKVSDKDVPRFAQLLNKSNQFNLRTQRYTEGQIHDLIQDKNARCLYVKLRDRFSEYGIISCVILRKNKEVCFIESWVMSCRVLKRGVEKLMFSGIIKIAEEMGCNKIVGEYIHSKKNGIVSDFYESIDFTCKQDDGVIKTYEYDMNKPYEPSIFIAEDYV